VTLLDDRTEFVRAAHLPDGVASAVGELPDLLRAHLPDAMTAIVVVTRGHRSDKEALRVALETAAGYVGMIGSPSKVRQIFRALRREGCTAEALSRVYAPIGLDLHAQTPDEIALSIAAELLLWRRGGTGAPLRDAQGILTRLLAEQTEGAVDEQMAVTEA
jgi:xanthine dehydrogenase accessory factor